MAPSINPKVQENTFLSPFQPARQVKILAVGSGSFLLSLVTALFESGLSKFDVLLTDSAAAHRQRLAECVEQARAAHPEASAKEIDFPKNAESPWRETVRPYDAVLFVSQKSRIEELQVLHAACREEKKTFLPAIRAGQVGLAGPLVHPDSKGDWESSWRRIHQCALIKDAHSHTFSSEAGALLANVIAFDLAKAVTGVAKPELKDQIFCLDLRTLEGSYYSFIPHPLVTGYRPIKQIQDLHEQIGRSTGRNVSNGLFSFFSGLTSAVSGIFHTWEEGELGQLPLFQCLVQPVDPLSDGPADLLPEMTCAGLTHGEARREAGLSGIEAYVSRLASRALTTPASNQSSDYHKIGSQEHVGIGAGETIDEAVCRGLQQWLEEDLTRQVSEGWKPSVIPVRLGEMEDERCRYYLQALTEMQGTPVIGLGEERFGFPVIWVGANGCWYGCAGLNTTWALRLSLQRALLRAQNESTCLIAQGVEAPSVHLEEKASSSLVISSGERSAQAEILQLSLQALKRNRKRLLTFDMAMEPFLREGLGGVVGVLVREEDAL